MAADSHPDLSAPALQLPHTVQLPCVRRAPGRARTPRNVRGQRGVAPAAAAAAVENWPGSAVCSVPPRQHCSRHSVILTHTFRQLDSLDTLSPAADSQIENETELQVLADDGRNQGT